MTRAPDLTRARSRVEALMVDSVAITRNPDGIRDATFNPRTGAITGDDTPTLIYDGPCIVKQVDGRVEYNREEITHEVLLPWDAAVPDVGDVVTVYETADTVLLDEDLSAAGVKGAGSFPVVRRFGVHQLRAGVPID